MRQTAEVRDAFERLFARGLAKEFEAIDRRNRLLGEWAAERLGKLDPLAYAIELNDIDTAAAGRNDMLFRLKRDFLAAGIYISDVDLEAQLERFFATAVDEILHRAAA